MKRSSYNSLFNDIHLVAKNPMTFSDKPKHYFTLLLIIK